MGSVTYCIYLGILTHSCQYYLFELEYVTPAIRVFMLYVSMLAWQRSCQHIRRLS